jgi:hypothetical protein
MHVIRTAGDELWEDAAVSTPRRPRWKGATLGEKAVTAGQAIASLALLIMFFGQVHPDWLLLIPGGVIVVLTGFSALRRYQHDRRNRPKSQVW